jgi:ATP-dependent 26S proteasome regulatory subunit
MDTARFYEVAGLGTLKRWLERRREAFLGDAAALGVDVPKGIMLLGVQGCGKSLAAKAVAGTWGTPLMRLISARSTTSSSAKPSATCARR